MAKKGRQIIYPVLQVLFVIALLRCLGPTGMAEVLPDPASPVRLTDAVGKYPLGARLAYLEDSSGQWMIEQVASEDFSRRFLPSREDIPGIGYSDSAFWVKITLEYTPEGGTAAKLWLLEVGYPLFDEVTFYFPLSDGRFRSMESGDRHPFARRDIKYRNPVFRLQTDAEKPVMVYVRIRTNGPVYLPFTLWSHTAFTRKVNDEQYIFGIYYGIMLVMIMYNLFLFLSVKDRNYLFYVLYILGITGMHASFNGFTFQYLWPAHPWWANQSTLFFIEFMQFNMALFTRSFLKARENTPRLNKILILFMIQAAMGMAAALTGLYAVALRIANVAIILEVSFVFGTGIVCWRRNYRPARWFTLAVSNFLAGGMIYALRVPGILPTNFFTTYAIQIGSVLEVTILAFALADRINMERREKLRAQKEALEAQAQVVKELQKVDRLKDEFLANTSHELRTPLNGIIGIAESLLAGVGGRLPRAAASNLSMVASSGRRLAHLINDILDFSRLKSRDITLTKRPVDIKAIVDTVLMVSRQLAAGKPLELKNDIPEDISPVLGDEDRLQQILYNLIGNAVKFTDSGEIVVSAEIQDAMVKISVSDTGVGIPQDRINDIFLSFEQADASEPVLTGFETPPGREVRVLAVDDDPVNLQVVVNHLSFLKIDVNTCASGIQALESIEKGDVPDLILLDVMMPRMTGYEVCRKLRERFAPSQLPIIMLTAKNLVTDLVYGFEAGANDYLVKPFSKDELIARVRNHMKLKEAYSVLRENLSLRNELEQRRQTLQDLRVMQRRLAGILDRVGEAVLAVNESGEIGFCNRPCEKLLGYEAEDLLGQTLSDFILDHGAERIMAMKEGPEEDDHSSNFHRVAFQRANGETTACEVQLFPLDLEEERLFLLIMQEPAGTPGTEKAEQFSALKVVEQLNRNRSRIQSLEESLDRLLAGAEKQAPGIALELKAVDAALEGLGRFLAGEDNPEGRRLLALEVMQAALEYWTEATGETKFEMARQSRLWQVYTNLDGWERAQTLDRYLDPGTFPQKPRMNKIIETADFVLAACDAASLARDRLEIALERLRAMR